MLAALALVCATIPGSFPHEPVKAEFESGFSLARKPKGFDYRDFLRTPNPRRSVQSVFRDHRQYVGWWSNGYQQIPIDEVVWLSPELLSRWLGFLAAQEYLGEQEIKDRWGHLSDALGEKRAFVVRLSSFPKMSTYGVGDTERNDPTDLDHVRFVYTSGNTVIEMESFQFAHWQSRDRFELDGFLWWQWLPIAGALQSEFEKSPEEAPLPLGDYHRTWTLAWVEGVDQEQFEVRVLSQRKERVARFRS